MNNFLQSRLAVWAISLCLIQLVIPDGFSAEPREQLLRMLPADIGVCLEFHGGKAEVARIRQSKMFERFCQLSIYQQWKAGNDFRDLQKMREGIEKLTGKPFGQFVGELFGDAVVLGFFPVDQGKHGGILLTSASSAADLEAAIAAWNRAEKQRTSKIEFAGSYYYQRDKLDKEGSVKETHYYFTFGKIFAFSDQASQIESALTLAAGKKADASLWELTAYQEAVSSLASDTHFSVFYQPSIWLAAGKSAQATDAEAKNEWFEQWANELFGAFQSVIIGVKFERGIVVECLGKCRPGKTPALWQEFATATAGASEFLKHVPQTASLVMTGRHSFAATGKWLSRQVNASNDQNAKTTRQMLRGLLLGNDLFDDILPQLGPDWGFFLVPDESPENNPVPVNGLLALRLPKTTPENKEMLERMRQGLDNGLNTGLNLLTAFYNNKAEVPAKLNSTETKELLMRWVTPVGEFQPAYAMTGDYLLFASQPTLIESFLDNKPAEKLLQHPAFAEWSERYFPEANQILFVNVSQIRGYLEKHHAYFIKQAANPARKHADAAEKRIQRLNEMLNLFDGAFLTGVVKADRVRFVLGAVAAPE